MTGKERTQRILNHQSVDRIGLFEHYWIDTHNAWRQAGYIKEGESFEDHFGYDMQECCFCLNMVADLDFERQVVAETEDTITYLDGNGAVLKRHKHHDSTPEHVDFLIKEREDWEERIKPLLTPDPRRINFEYYRASKKDAEEHGRFFVWGGLDVFECIHPVCGHENMLAGMVLDPEWVADMANTYAKLIVDLQQILFDQEGYPDGIWYYEDMGYKGSPFMSPAMYKELIQPAHKYTNDYAKSKNLPIIMHSCGYVEPLLPGMIESGIDCLQALEVKAGMDLLKLHKQYGDKISFMGGIDVRALYSNDKAVIDRELEAKIPIVKEGFNYFLHSDHSIPKTVDYDTYCYFVERGLELGTY